MAVVVTSCGGLSLPASAQADPQLRAAGTVIRNGDGKQVILRGVQVINKLQSPYLPNVGPADFARIRSWGLNSIRLGILWAGIMPTRGVVDHAYLDGLKQIVDEATAAGLYVILDMHQDLWSAKVGGNALGDGAPSWADPTDPWCPVENWDNYAGTWEANYFSPSVGCGFYNFWTDAGNLQEYYTKAWQAVAQTVAGNPMVAGVDLINEPFSGPIPPGVFETRFLYPSEFSWLAAIRHANPPLIGFFEPPITENAHGPVLPAINPPANVVYAPHLYGAWNATTQLPALERFDAETFNYATSIAAAMGIPMWLGEFSDNPGSSDDQSFVSQEYRLADHAAVGASFWEYGTLWNSHADQASSLLTSVMRAYPESVAGTISSMSFDAGTKTLAARWSQNAPGSSTFAVPSQLYPNGVSVQDAPASDWSLDQSTGTLTVTTGPGTHSLTVSPA